MVTFKEGIKGVLRKFKKSQTKDLPKQQTYQSTLGGQGTTTTAPTTQLSDYQRSVMAETEKAKKAKAGGNEFTRIVVRGDNTNPQAKVLQRVRQGQVIEEKSLSPLEYQRYGMAKTEFPNIQPQVAGDPVAQALAGLKDQRAYNAYVQALQSENLENLNVPQEPDVEQRSVLGATVRESIPGAVATIGTSTAAGALIGGSAGLGVGAVPGAIIGGAFGIGKSIYDIYKANHKEEVSNTWQGFRGLKTGITENVQSYNSGVIGPTQARINMIYQAQQLDYYESNLREKEAAGDFIADISDYDGKMAYIQEYKTLYFPLQQAEIEKGIATGQPITELQAPVYPGDVEEI